jgi:hypothetical protein
MDAARRARIFLAYDGRCACGKKIEGAFEIDHDSSLWVGGPDTDEACRPLCIPCHKAKTSKDAAVRSHIKALWKKAAFAPRKPSKIRSGRKLKGAPMSKRPKTPKPAAPTRPAPSRYAVQFGPTRPAPGSLLKSALRLTAREKADEAKNRPRRR